MFGCITQLWAGGKSAALPFGKVSCRMMPAAVYSLEAAEWQKHSFLNVSKMEKQLVMMHNILFLFFSLIFCKYSDNCTGQCPECCRNLPDVFIYLRHESHHCLPNPRSFFMHASCYLTINDYTLQVKHKYCILFFCQHLWKWKKKALPDTTWIKLNILARGSVHSTTKLKKRRSMWNGAQQTAKTITRTTAMEKEKKS